MRPVLQLALIAILFSACGVKIPPPPDVSGLESLSDDDSKVALEEVRLHGGQIRSFRGRLTVNMKSALGEERLTQVTVFERPDKLRMEFFATGLNKLTAMLITRADSLHAVDPVNMKVYRGRSSMEVVRKLLSVPFTSSDIMLWLVGRIEPPANEKLLEPSVYTGKNSLVVRYSLEDGRKFVAQFEPTKGSENISRIRLLNFEVRSQDGERLLISHFSYSDAAGSAEPLVPESITFWIPEENLEGELRYDEREINPDLSKDRGKLFLGRTPAGAKIIDLGDKNSVLDIERFL